MKHTQPGHENDDEEAICTSKIRAEVNINSELARSMCTFKDTEPDKLIIMYEVCKTNVCRRKHEAIESCLDNCASGITDHVKLRNKQLTNTIAD